MPVQNDFQFRDAFGDLVTVQSLENGSTVKVEFLNILQEDKASMIFTKRNIRDLENVLEILKRNF